MPGELTKTVLQRKRLSRKNPGLIIFLLDQSGSMAGNNKMRDAARAVNDAINEIVLHCTRDEGIRDYCIAAVIGYGATFDTSVKGWIRDVAVKNKTDDRGKPTWVQPKAEGGTPMAEALSRAYDVAKNFVNLKQEMKDKDGNTFIMDCQNSFPPIVINVTDGAPSDFDKGHAPQTEQQASRLLEISTRIGNLLLFNAHISGTEGLEIQFPTSEGEITGPIDQHGLMAADAAGNVMPAGLFATLLFRMSSVLTGPVYEDALKAGFDVHENSRGFVFNAGPKTLIRFIEWGTTPLKRTTE